MKIEKKTWPEQFDAISRGEKRFDVRLADFDCEVGDTLVLWEWNPQTKRYTSRAVEKKIKYVLKTREAKFWKEEDVQKHGFQIIGF
ncbi:DUF3850 domain-containing protein [Candidatus Pacearchaeota archaeon]|nr:DUF3850 domain-containing protein [Candidatus Pacearchaeota archaeon]